MGIPGWRFLAALRAGKTTVVVRGPIAAKILRGGQARRKYFSEHAARLILAQVGIATVPILARFMPFKLLIMPNAGPTLNTHLTLDNLAAFDQHITQFARITVPRTTPPGYYWLDRSRRMHPYDSFVEFLMGEFGRRALDFIARFPSFDLEGLRGIFQAAEAHPARLLVPTDIAPKNVTYANGRFAHLDLEATLIGPPEFLLVKAAVNLASDVGTWEATRPIRAGWLERCPSRDNARAVLAFALVNRMLYDAPASRSNTKALTALRLLLDGGALASVVNQIEAGWDLQATST